VSLCGGKLHFMLRVCAVVDELLSTSIILETGKDSAVLSSSDELRGVGPGVRRPVYCCSASRERFMLYEELE
jgi:hypothetical protein